MKSHTVSSISMGCNSAGLHGTNIPSDLVPRFGSVYSIGRNPVQSAYDNSIAAPVHFVIGRRFWRRGASGIPQYSDLRVCRSYSTKGEGVRYPQ